MIIYRTKDGQADYAFNIERVVNGTWRVYIERQPSYRGRAEDAHSTHRLSEGGRTYVCWDRGLWSEADARNVARRWADNTQEYIKYGMRF